MAQVPYQGYANVAPESGGLAGGSSDYSSVPEANANAFGAQVGGAMQNAGQQVDQLAQKFSDIPVGFNGRIPEDLRIENEVPIP